MTDFFAGYRKRATGDVSPADMAKLSELIIRPGIEKHLDPLLLYRGALNRGAAHRFWNASLMMMACEVETLADGLKIFDNHSFSQLCGPVKPPPKLTLASFFTRLWSNPKVTDNIPGLTKYVRSLELGKCTLQPVSLYAERSRCAEWRIFDPKRMPDGTLKLPKIRKPKQQQLFYPFLVHDTGNPDNGFALVKLANALVPDYLPASIRADACQDLIVGLLSGEVSAGEAVDHVEKYVRDALKTLERHVFSLDAQIVSHDWNAEKSGMGSTGMDLV